MILKLINILFLTVIMLSQVEAQKDSNIIFSEYDLANGLHVILHEDHNTPVVVTSVMYHVGAKNESPDRTGFAHFFEHLLFEGTENIGRGEFIKTVQNCGGEVNANTTNDRTFYYEILPSNYLETGLWLESERMLHARVDRMGIETQRSVVKEERRQRYDNRPYGTIIEEGMKRAFTIHPYHWTTIGSMDHLDAATEDDYIRFYETWYVPDNAVLTITGDFNTANVKILIDKYFGSIPAGTQARTRPAFIEPPLVQEIKDTIYDNVQLPAIIQFYRIPAYGTREYYIVKLLAELLTGGASSRLSKKLIDEDQVAVSVSSFAFNLEDPGVYTQMAVGNIGINAEQLETLIDQQMEIIRTTLISESEFQKLSNCIETNVARRNGSLLAIAEALSTNFLYLQNSHRINEEISIYQSITRAEMREIAKNYFSPTNRVTLYWLPKPNNSAQ